MVEGAFSHVMESLQQALYLNHNVIYVEHNRGHIAELCLNCLKLRNELLLSCPPQQCYCIVNRVRTQKQLIHLRRGISRTQFPSRKAGQVTGDKTGAVFLSFSNRLSASRQFLQCMVEECS